MAKPIFDVEKVDDITVLILNLTDVVHAENEKLIKPFEDLLNTGRKKIVLDLTNTTYISSIILASLVYIHKRAKDEGGNLILCSVKNRVMEIVKMTYLDKVLDIVPTKTEALQKLIKT